MRTADQPLVDAEGEVRELTSADFKRARKASEALPLGLQVKLGIRDAESNPVKETAHAKRRALGESSKGFERVAAKVARDFEEEVKNATDALAFSACKTPSRAH